MRVARLSGRVSAHLVLLACALVTMLTHVSGNSLPTSPEPSCPVSYKPELHIGAPGPTAPLLLGGVWGGCEIGCQPRDDRWGQICQADPDALAVINVCEHWQQSDILETAMRVSKGAVEHFSPCDFHQYLKGRTLWLVGDSHTKNLYNAMRCFLIDFFDHAEGECAASSDKELQSLLEQAALKGHIYNTPPRCLHLIGGGRVCLVHSPMGTTLVSTDAQVLGTLQLLHQFLADPSDIIVTSFGRWHSNNCEGVDEGYTGALEQVGAYLRDQRLQFPHVFFQPSNHDHTICINGVFNDTLPVCLPAAEGGYDLGISAKLHLEAHTIMTQKYGIPVIDSHEASLFLHNGHVLARQTIGGKTDCLHYCRPGMPELDIWYMTSSFASSGVPKLSSGDQVRQCVRLPLQAFKPFGALQVNSTVLLNSTVLGNTTTPPPAVGHPPGAETPGEEDSSMESPIANLFITESSSAVSPGTEAPSTGLPGTVL